MDFSNLFGGASPGAGGWTTTMQYGKSPLSWSLDDKLAGFAMPTMQQMGSGMQSLGGSLSPASSGSSSQAMGAFGTGPGQDTQAPPSAFAPGGRQGLMYSATPNPTLARRAGQTPTWMG